MTEVTVAGSVDVEVVTTTPTLEVKVVEHPSMDVGIGVPGPPGPPGAAAGVTWDDLKPTL